MIHDVVPPFSHLSNYLEPGTFFYDALSGDRTEGFLFRGPGTDGVLPLYMYIRLDATFQQLHSSSFAFSQSSPCP
jgi:hypothetical protein